MPAPDSRYEMHVAFISELRERRAEMEKALNDLKTVEEFHLEQIQRYEAPDKIGGEMNGHRSAIKLDAPIHASNIVACHQPLGSADRDESVNREEGPHEAATKHEAAAWALHKYGRPMKVGAMVQMLQRAGYGTDLERRVLHNSLHTAMVRKPDQFKKAGGGFWELEKWEPAKIPRGENATTP